MSSLKRYIFIAIGTAIVVALIGYVGAGSLIPFVADIKAKSVGLGAISTLVLDPIIWVLQNPALGGVLTGVMWPLAVLDLAALFVVVLIALGGGAAGDVGTQLGV